MSQRHHRRAVLTDDRHHPRVPGFGAVAVLEVHRVDDAAAAEHLQAGLHHVRLGGVQHDRQGGRGGEPAGQLPHVLRAVAADVVHAQVEQVRAVARLAAGDLHTGPPVAGEHRLPERLRAVGVGPLPHHQHRRVLGERHRVVDRRDARLVPGFAGRGGDAVQPLGQHPDVLRGGAAAAADQPHAVLGDEPLQGLGQLHGSQREVRPVGGQHRQAGVRHHRQRDAGVLRQVTQVLAHLGRAGRAVEPDQVHAERLDRGEGRADLAADQHGAGGLHGHVTDDRHRLAQLGHRPLRPDHGRLDLKQVLAGLDDQRVRAADDQTRGVLLVGVAQGRVGGVPEGGQLGARPDRTEHEPGPLRGAGRVGGLPGDPGARLGQLADAVRDVVLGEVGEVGPEGVGLHAVGTGGQIGVVHPAHHVRAGDVEDLVAPLEPVEVVEREVRGLKHRAHRAVGDENPISQHIHQ